MPNTMPTLCIEALRPIATILWIFPANRLANINI